MAAAQAAMANLMVFMVVLVWLFWFGCVGLVVLVSEAAGGDSVRKIPDNRIGTNSAPTPRQAPNLRRSAYNCIHLSFGAGCSNLSLAFDPVDR
jgi:hypothetical protein